jgi:hypothetical protein
LHISLFLRLTAIKQVEVAQDGGDFLIAARITAGASNFIDFIKSNACSDSLLPDSANSK